MADNREKHLPYRFQPGGNLDRVPQAFGELFKLASNGSIKIEITKYPLGDASVAHSLLEGRKSTGKLILIP